MHLRATVAVRRPWIPRLCCPHVSRFSFVLPPWWGFAHRGVRTVKHGTTPFAGGGRWGSRGSESCGAGGVCLVRFFLWCALQGICCSAPHERWCVPTLRVLNFSRWTLDSIHRSWETSKKLPPRIHRSQWLQVFTDYLVIRQGKFLALPLELFDVFLDKEDREVHRALYREPPHVWRIDRKLTLRVPTTPCESRKRCTSKRSSPKKCLLSWGSSVQAVQLPNCASPSSCLMMTAPSP